MVEQHNRNGSHLGKRVGLAHQARSEFPPSCCSVQGCRHKDNANVPAEHQDRNSQRHEAFVQEHKKECAQQQLVGYRIQVLSNDGTLFQSAGEQSVKCVRDASHQEEYES